MKNIIKGFGLVMALVASSAYAVPTLFFDGDISYDSTSGLLSVSSVLTATQEITPVPELFDSSLNFTALFDYSAYDAGFDATAGFFTTAAGTDLTAIDGNGIELLRGDFADLTVVGFNGDDSGFVTGTLNASGGSLQDEFGIGNLIALEFNLSTPFSPDMFRSDFSGGIDGRIEGETVGVPEPSMPALLALGILFIGLVNRAGIKQRFDV
jgi:hypothetical protein